MESESKINYRFKLEDEANWRQFLKTHGFVVFANYLTKQEAAQEVDKAWKIMQILSDSKLSKEKEETHRKNENYPFNLHGGMIQYVGHSKFQWDLRKKCKKIYQKLWNCQDLASSFDGFCFMNGKRKYPYVAPDQFLHTDQAPNKKYFWCYQGLINLVDSNEESGGLVLIPGSHLKHKNYFEEKKIESTKNWYKVPQQDKHKEPFLPVQKLNVEAGDFAVWDGRTFHCNTTPTSQDLRVCTYIAMIPKKDVPPLTEKRRLQYFAEKKTTNHHPGDGMKLLLECPRFIDDKQDFMEKVKTVNDVDETDPGVLALI